VLSAPSSSPDTTVPLSEPIATHTADVIFVEVFAGSGVLTDAVKVRGIKTRDPDDAATGGTDFTRLGDVESLRAELADLQASGTKIMLHLAPPCSTFSRARDRSWRTRLRSLKHPQGIPGRAKFTKSANLIARRTLDLAEWAADLGMAVSIENPKASYIWSYLDFNEECKFRDAIFSPCRFGSIYRKPTRVRCWNWFPVALDAECKLTKGSFSCGRTKENLHPPFGIREG
jgi:hypothetical protein